MALGTSLNYIFSGEVRVRVPDGLNIMGTVTIIAFGSCRVTQFGYLAMKSLKISFGLFLVTSSTLIYNIELKSFQISPSDSMRCMTIVTHWKGFISLGFTREMDALGKFFVNPMVTLSAGLSDVISVHS